MSGRAWPNHTLEAVSAAALENADENWKRKGRSLALMGLDDPLISRLGGEPLTVSSSRSRLTMVFAAAEAFKTEADASEYLRLCGVSFRDFGWDCWYITVMLSLPASVGLTPEEAAALVSALGSLPAYERTLPPSWPKDNPGLSLKAMMVFHASGLLSSTQAGALRWMLDEGFTPAELAMFFAKRPTGPVRDEFLKRGVVNVPAFVRCDLIHEARANGVSLENVALLHDWWGTASETVLALCHGLPLEYAREVLSVDALNFERIGIDLVL